MQGIETFMVIGIIAIVIFLSITTAGIIILVTSVLKTVKGNKKIGGRIAGGVMIAMGLFMTFYSGSMLLVGGYVDLIATSSEASRIERKLTDAIAEKDEDALSDLFASRSYSGDEIHPEDAEQLFDYLEDYEISSNKIVGTSFHNDIKEVEYKFILENDDGEKSTLIFYCITKANNSNKKYVGIQYIQLNQGKSVTEYGAKPKLH